MKILSSITIKDFIEDRDCKAIYKSVMDLKDSWSNYSDRFSLGSGKESTDTEDTYKDKCLTYNPVIFEKFPSLLFKIKQMLNNMYVEDLTFEDTYSSPAFEIIQEDGTYYNLNHKADRYFVLPIHVGNSSSALFYYNKPNTKKYYIPMYEGNFYFYTNPLHKYYEKISENNDLICLEGKCKMNKNNKITLFF